MLYEVITLLDLKYRWLSSISRFFERPSYFPNNYVLNTKIVKNDHAIGNLISEVHDRFLNAKFVPFIIGNSYNFV